MVPKLSTTFLAPVVRSSNQIAAALALPTMRP